MNFNKLPRENEKYIKINEPKIEPMQHFEFLENIENPMSSILRSVYASIVDMTDNAICEAVINYAKNEGVTDIYLIDKEFVKNALMKEISRIVYENEEKKAKEMGFVRVKPNLPKLHKPHTNFDRITENEGTLAKAMVHEVWDNYYKRDFYRFLDGKVCDTREEAIQIGIEWLQKEADNEKS